jgi:hypothetical protein
MRYHYEIPDHYLSKYGELYRCNHPIYSRCTLYQKDLKGLAVIQQRYDPKTKYTWWTDIDPWLRDDLYLNKGFSEYFEKTAKSSQDGLYPTVTIRQIMWALHMKPLPKMQWETVFDHKL